MRTNSLHRAFFHGFILLSMALVSLSCNSNRTISLVHASGSCLNFQSSTSNPDIHGEGVCQVPNSPNVYTLMVEIGFSATAALNPSSGALQLSFPPNKTITDLNGTLSYYSNCPWGPTLIPPNGTGNVALVRVFTSSDPNNPGTRVPSYSWVIKNGATDGKTVFIDDHIPMQTGDGNGSFEVFTDLPVVTPTCFLSAEFQGHMTIE
jgi:hypothetical protein